MKYRNIKTGAVIDVTSKMNGNWVKVENVKSSKRETVVPDLPISVDVEEEDIKPVKRPRRTAKKTEEAPKKRISRKKKD